MLRFNFNLMNDSRFP